MEGIRELKENEKAVYLPNDEVVKVEHFNSNGSIAVEFQDGTIEDVEVNDLKP